MLYLDDEVSLENDVNNVQEQRPEEHEGSHEEEEAEAFRGNYQI